MKKILSTVLLLVFIFNIYTYASNMGGNFNNNFSRCPINGRHVYSEATCTSPRMCTCGATKGTILPHSLSEWIFDSSVHYQVCGSCNEQFNTSTHAVGEDGKCTAGCGYFEEVVPKECEHDVDSNGLCIICGEQIIEVEEEPKVCTHESLTEYIQGAEKHYKACLICGEVVTSTEESHLYNWGYSNTEHKKVCDVCGYRTAGEAHVIDSTGQCTDGCGYYEEVQKECEHDVNSNGLCIICGEQIFEVEVEPEPEVCTHGSLTEYVQGTSNHYKICLICGVAVTSTERSHSFRWEYTNYGHNQVCEVCSYRTSVEAHSTDSNGKCTASCGYYVKVDKCTSHSSKGWTYDSSRHYLVCTNCNEKYESATHSMKYISVDSSQHKAECSVCGYSTGSKENHLFSAFGKCVKCSYDNKSGLTCTHSTLSSYISNEEQHYKTCTSCGIRVSETAGNHTYGWDYSESQHRKMCTECKYVVGVGGHTLDADGKCTEGCGYTKDITAECTHPVSSLGSWKYDDTSHWRICNKCNVKINVAKHSLNSDGECQSVGCNYVVVSKKTVLFSDKMQVLDYEKKNSRLNTLAINLRNDSISEKSNKNVYGLGEVVTYYIDYANGGEDIKNIVEIKLELPLKNSIVKIGNYEVENNKISTDNIEITSDGKCISWKFLNGMKRGDADTLAVTLKYAELSRNSGDTEIIYPLATIYNSSVIADKSAVINYIYRDSNTLIQEIHEPYMKGDADTKRFRPDANLTRAEGTLVLARIMFGQDEINKTVISSIFPDIGETYEEAQKAITLATTNGLINGFTDGTFKPNETMTRAEFMKILATYMEIKAKEDTIQGLDIKELSKYIKIYKDSRYTIDAIVDEHWAIEEVTLLLRLNMLPLSSTSIDLRMDEKITRAEVTQLINFFLIRAPQVVEDTAEAKFEDVDTKHLLISDILEATIPVHNFYILENGTERAIIKK